MHFENTDFFCAEHGDTQGPSCSLTDRNIALCSIWNIKVAPVLMGLHVGQQFHYSDGMQQKVTRGNMIAAMGMAATTDGFR